MAGKWFGSRHPPRRRSLHAVDRFFAWRRDADGVPPDDDSPDREPAFYEPPDGWSLLTATLRLYARVPRLLAVSAAQALSAVAAFALVWHPLGAAPLRRVLEGAAAPADVALLAAGTGLALGVGLVLVAFANGVAVALVAGALDDGRPAVAGAVRTVAGRWRAVARVAVAGSPLGSLLWFATTLVYALFVRPLLFVLSPAAGLAKRLGLVATRAASAALVGTAGEVLGRLLPGREPPRPARVGAAPFALPAVVLDGDDPAAAYRRSDRLWPPGETDLPSPARRTKVLFLYGWVLLVLPGGYALAPVVGLLGHGSGSDYGVGLVFGLYTVTFLAVASGLVALARYGVYRYARTGEAPDDAFAYRPCREAALAAGTGDDTVDAPTGPDDARGDPA